jgi:hypothetical protein
MSAKPIDLDNRRLWVDLGTVVQSPRPYPAGLKQVTAFLRRRPEYIPHMAALLDFCEHGEKVLLESGMTCREFVFWDINMWVCIWDGKRGNPLAAKARGCDGEYRSRRPVYLTPGWTAK